MMTDAAPLRIRLAGLSIRRGRRTLVQGLAWEHEPGRIAWIVGENGAGKSSLLRVLAGRLRPSAGTLAIAGVGARPVPRIYYHPAMRPPGDATVAGWRRFVDALAPPAGARDVSGIEPEIPDPARRLDRLSTGEAKRLLLAALLARPAPLVVLDEPYEHLSAGARARLTDLLVTRARTDLVIVATNQDIPPGAEGPRLRVERESWGIETPAGAAP